MSATSLGPVSDQESVMEFGLDQLRTGLRQGSNRFELSRHVEIARTCSNLVADRSEAKFHYTVLVADRSGTCLRQGQRNGIWLWLRSEAGRRHVADLLARASSLLVIGQIPVRCRSATSFGPVCDQDSVTEFGLIHLTNVQMHRYNRARQ